jgi:hypothetical protein
MCTVDDFTSPTFDFAYPLRQHLYFKAGFNINIFSEKTSEVKRPTTSGDDQISKTFPRDSSGLCLLSSR